MTGKEFKDKILQITANEDTESAHAHADDILCLAVKQLSVRRKDKEDWQAGIEAFQRMNKWYA